MTQLELEVAPELLGRAHRRQNRETGQANGHSSTRTS